MNFHQTVITCLLLSFSFVLSISSNYCNQSCGNGGGRNRVQYPFGFSDGCGIKLNCTNGNIMIGDFVVQNVSRDRILVDLPGNCSRPTDQLEMLFGQNYAMTRRNGLLLLNCSQSEHRAKQCLLPRGIAQPRFSELQTCEDRPAGDNSSYEVTCFSDGFSATEEFLEYDQVRIRANCRYVFSSIALDWDESFNGNYNTGGDNGGSSTVALEFRTAELGWWLAGNCTCDPNADCRDVSHNQSRIGYRCHCREGYAGDGFAGGEGCRKVSDRKVSNYLSDGCRGAKVGILIGAVMGVCGFAGYGRIWGTLK